MPLGGFLSRNAVLLSADGGDVHNQTDQWDRSTVITYDNTLKQFVFSARRWNERVSSFICQLKQGLSFVQYHFTELRFKYYFRFYRRIIRSALSIMVKNMF